jgi:hypothetical protein
MKERRSRSAALEWQSHPKGKSMKKGTIAEIDKKQPDPDLLPEYDFSNGVRGKYVQQLADGSNIVVLAPDVAELFPDSESVNEGPADIDKACAKAKQVFGKK